MSLSGSVLLDGVPTVIKNVPFLLSYELDKVAPPGSSVSKPEESGGPDLDDFDWPEA